VLPQGRAPTGSVGVHQSAHPLEHTWGTELSGTDLSENIDQDAAGVATLALTPAARYDRGKDSLQGRRRTRLRLTNKLWKIPYEPSGVQTFLLDLEGD